MKNIIWKDIFRDIKKSKGRFFSIVAIVALGVMLFSGVKIAPIDMKKSADAYYDNFNLMDIRLVSTLGLTEEDVEEVKKIQGVLGLYPSYTMDGITKIDIDEFALRIHSIPINNLKNSNENYINRVNVVEGRLPEKSGECVIGYNKIDGSNVKIGDKLVVNSGTDDDISKSLKVSEFEIVGLVETPYYLSFQIGSTNIGNGTLKTYMMIPDIDFNMDAFTEIYITVDGAKEVNSYNEEYFEIIDKVKESLEDISEERIDSRYEIVIKKANEELEKGKKEYNQKKEEVEQKLKDAYNEIENSKLMIAQGEEEISANEIFLETSIKDGEVKINAAEKKLEEGEKQYEQKLIEYNVTKNIIEGIINTLNNRLTDLESKLQPVEDRINALKLQLKDENVSDYEKETINNEINTLNEILKLTRGEISTVKEEFNNQKLQLKEGEAQLNLAKKEIDDGKAILEKEKANLENARIQGKNQIAAARAEIESGKKKVEEGEETYRKNKLLAEEELKKAEEKLKDAEDKIKKIEKPKWYILDRESHYSYMDYKNTAEGIDKLSNVFPLFFFLVAALVCLTTMTRMVDEQRVNIGTLKALGYGMGTIAKKFIYYSFFASTIGSIIGLACGFSFFPVIIYNAYRIMYLMPDMVHHISIPIIIIVSFAAIGLTTLVTYFTCRIELRETPSILMRPKAPKEGKRILLERIPFIWDKFNFTGKVTIRNLFRYKKRFFMTTLGIAGSTALLLAGFGIKDSIKTIVNKQFGVIYRYEMAAELKSDVNALQREDIKSSLDENSSIKDYAFVKNERCKVSVNNENEEEEINLIVPNDYNEFESFFNLKERVSKDSIELPKGGVAITEKVAKLIGAKIGDEIKIVNNNDNKGVIKISSIVENYVGHNIYMDSEYYEKTFNRKLYTNQIIIKLNENEAVNEVGSEIINIEGISGVVNTIGLKEQFNDTISSLNIVIIVMILSAGSLAFVVLYNLTNVNISERIREIATIKVLGFYDKEVSSYIFRENILLTIFGLGCGLGLGVIFHRFIMVTVEMENMMFGRNIDLISFIYAAALTITFSIIVNLVMYFKLKTIEMVESLKSVD